MGDRWILAVDLGNGGPKVAVVTLAGRAAAHGAAPGLRARRPRRHRDPGRLRVVGAAARRRARGDRGVAGRPRRAARRRHHRPVGLDRAGRCRRRARGPVLLWADTRARPLVNEILGGPVSVSGYAPHKVLPFVRATAGAPTPSGADPTGHSLLLQRRMREVYDRTRVLLEPVDYLGHALHRPRRRHTGLDDRELAHRQPARRRARLRRRPRTPHPPRPRPPARAAAHRLGARRAHRRGRGRDRRGAGRTRSSAASPTCTRPSSAPARCGRTRRTSRSRRRRGSARACRSSAPTCSTRWPRSPGSTRRSRSSATTRRPGERRCSGCASRSSRRTTACSAAAAASAARAWRAERLVALVRRPARRSPPPHPRAARALLFMPWLNGERSPVRGQAPARRLAQRVAAHRPRDARALGARGRRLQRALAVRLVREVPQAARAEGAHPRRGRAERPVVPDPRRRPRPPGRADRRPAQRPAARCRAVGPHLPRRAHARGGAGARARGAALRAGRAHRRTSRGTASTASSPARSRASTTASTPADRR